MSSKALAESFENWARTRDLVTAFGEALEMLVCEFTPHWIDPETKQLRGRYTDKYLETAKRYPDEHIRQYYPPLCKAIMQSYDEGVTADGQWCDPLGDYFQEIASNRDKSWKGQFFTPKPVCDLMAQMTMIDQESKPGLNILDCACGSGRLQIAFDRSCPPHSHHFYVGVDIDPRCIRIAALNFFFHGMKGVVICGNSLSLETRFGYYIHHPLTGQGIEHLNAATCEKYLFMAKEEKQTRPPEASAGGQLQLFDL